MAAVLPLLPTMWDQDRVPPQAGSSAIPHKSAIVPAQERGVAQLSPGHLRIKVRREITYDLVRPTRHVFDCADATLARIAGTRPVFFVTDALVGSLHRCEIERYAGERLHCAGFARCSGAESDKTLRSVEAICEAAHAVGLRRDGIIVAVGGGVTLDLAGFAAAIFRRGIGYVRVPTTLIGLVDVAVGIKQGANSFGSKNMLGAFYPPLASILDYTFLETLPRACLSAGFAEILKMAIIRDESLLRAIEQHGRSLIDSGYRSPYEPGRRIAERAEFLMAEELAGNLYETDLARLVDFGHTFSPVIETASHYTITHGEAVALDILLSTSVAAQRGICAKELFDRLARIVADLRLPLWHSRMATIAQLKEALNAARRHRGGALNLVVPCADGDATFLQSVSDHELETAVRHLQKAAGRFTPEADAPLSQETDTHACVGV
jgi:2-epi-5-epi-valiolone synthase